MYDSSNVPSRRPEEPGEPFTWWGQTADENESEQKFVHETAKEVKGDGTLSNRSENSMDPPNLPFTRLARRRAPARHQKKSTRKGQQGRGQRQHEKSGEEDATDTAESESTRFKQEPEETTAGEVDRDRKREEQVTTSNSTTSPEGIQGQQSPTTLKGLSPRAPIAAEVIELHPLQVTIDDWSRVKGPDEPLWAYFDSNMKIFHVVTVHGQYQYLLSIPISTIEKATFCLSPSLEYDSMNEIPDTLVIRLTKPPSFYGSNLQSARVWTPISDFTVDQVATNFLLYAFSLGVTKSETESLAREEMILSLAKWECLRNVVKIMKRPSPTWEEETPLAEGEGVSHLVEEESSSYIPSDSHYSSFDEYTAQSNQAAYEGIVEDGYSSTLTTQTQSYQSYTNSNSEEEYYDHPYDSQEQHQLPRDESQYPHYSLNPYPHTYPYHYPHSYNNATHRQTYVYGPQSVNHWPVGRGDRALSV